MFSVCKLFLGVVISVLLMACGIKTLPDIEKEDPVRATQLRDMEFLRYVRLDPETGCYYLMSNGRTPRMRINPQTGVYEHWCDVTLIRKP